MSFQAQGNKSVHRTRRRAAQVTSRGSPPDRSARPGPPCAYCDGQGRAGAGLGRAPQRAPPGRRPRTARASPAPGREARPGTASPRVAGRGHPLPARLPAGQGGPARPHPASAFPAPAGPTPPYLPAAATTAQPGLAPGKAPPPSAPIGGPAPKFGSHWASRHRGGAAALPALAALHPGNARLRSRDGRGARGCQRFWGNPPQNSYECFTKEPRPTAPYSPAPAVRVCPRTAPGRGSGGKRAAAGLSAALTGEGRAVPVAPPFPTPKRALVAPLGKEPRDSQRASSVRVPQGTAPCGLVSLAHRRTSGHFP